MGRKQYRSSKVLTEIVLKVRDLWLSCGSIADLTFKNDDRYKVNPRELLIDAVSDNREIGSCTCVIATLDEEKPILYTANLGDSGYLLLRKEGIDLVSKHRTKEQ